MNKEKIFTWWTLIKLILFISFMTVVSIIVTAIEPTISASFAVGQLEDTYMSNAGLQIYQKLKGYAWISYLVLCLATFFSEIKKLFKAVK